MMLRRIELLKFSRSSTFSLRRFINHDNDWNAWISKYRLTVNQVFRDISEHNVYLLKASESSIDLPNWKSYANRFRRSLFLFPDRVLPTEEQRIKFCETMEAIHHNSIAVCDIKTNENEYEHIMTKQLQNDKLDIFNCVLSQAQIDLKDYIAAYDVLASTSDLRVPHEWYPQTRLTKRKIIYHGGPTNSGKTYQALQRLKNADVTKGGGLYCGPLRLLALEVYENLNRQGIYTNLMTGQEKREVPGATHISCTVEMVNVSTQYDVAVIDEIQMIGSKERGSAWTRALQGLQAREIHVCGGLEAADIVKSLAASTGDDFELKEYKRLSSLVVNEESLRGDYSKVRPGDCIVAFSKADIFSIRRQIELLTPYKCAIIYGQLPPETRSTQARLFNENNSGYDILVASDAIGMGLNLNIRRIIFHNTLKGGGSGGVYWVDPSSVKQIAGRAGRMSSDYKIGEVSAWQDADLAYVRAVMAWDIPQIKSVGIFPSVEQIELFSTQLSATIEHDANRVLSEKTEDVLDASAAATTTNEENDDKVSSTYSEVVTIPTPTPAPKIATESKKSTKESSKSTQASSPADFLRLSMIVERFVKLSKTDGRYFICDYESLLVVANWLHSIPLTVADKFLFSTAPVNIRDPVSMHVLYRFAATYALQRPVPLQVKLSRSLPRDLESFTNLCIKHNVLELYLWLSFRFPKYFIEQATCYEQKKFAVTQIEKTLMSSGMSQTYNFSSKYLEMREKLRDKGLDEYPPAEFGDIRDNTKIFIDALNPETVFVKPPAKTSFSEVTNSERDYHGRRQNFDRNGGGSAHRVKYPITRLQKKVDQRQHVKTRSTTSHAVVNNKKKDSKIDMLTVTD